MLNVEHVSACTCADKRPVNSAIMISDAVIVGTIISKEIITITEPFPYDSLFDATWLQSWKARYEFRVERTYKGVVTQDTVILYTGTGDWDCGNEFTIGEKYIVYGYNTTEEYKDKNWSCRYKLFEQNIFWTNVCTRTTKFNTIEIDEIEKVLDWGK